MPARNEGKNLPDVLARVPDWVYEVILVDGLSVDDTSAVARLHMPSIRVVHQTGRGKGNALIEGFAQCAGDIIIAIDADGSMDPAEMGAFVEALEAGHDYVKGSRMVADGGSTDLTRFRGFGNWIFRTVANVLVRSRYTDLCYGYFGFVRGTVDGLDLRSTGFEIEAEITVKAHKAGLRITEVGSWEAPRSHGVSNLNAFRDGWRILTTILKSSFSSTRRSAGGMDQATESVSATDQRDGAPSAQINDLSGAVLVASEVRDQRDSQMSLD